MVPLVKTSRCTQLNKWTFEVRGWGGEGYDKGKTWLRFWCERVQYLYLLGAVFRDDLFKGQEMVDAESAAQRVNAG